MLLRSSRFNVTTAVGLLLAIVGQVSAKASSQNREGAQSHAISWRTTRGSPDDLEISGELTGLPVGTIRYVTRGDLLALPQVSYTVEGDSNFRGPTRVSGVLLEELSHRFGSRPEAEMVDAICVDLYQAHYPRAYVAAHHPILVLTINGQPPELWPESHGVDMGPYLISHEAFTPSFQILAHSDEAQIPWGVVRLDFRDERSVLGTIAPRGPRAKDPAVLDGYRIAQQNCFRCHNMGSEGGRKARHPWFVLAGWAASSPEYFAAYVRNPKKKNSQSQMPGSPNYDDATMQALTAYFRTFVAEETP
jgi:mono/diheme cytochrome c family protein